MEIALEEGDLDVAERLLTQALPRFGRRPELESLGRRIQEVKHLARQPTIDSLVKQSQECIRLADYDGATAFLRRATSLAPHDDALKGLLSQTEKAAARHAAAVDRQNAVGEAGRDVERFLNENDVAAARTRLAQARAELGRHTVFDQAEARIEATLRGALDAEVADHIHRASRLRADRDWQGVLSHAEAAASLEPDNADAARLKAEAEQALLLLENQRHLKESVESVVQDVERLIDAGELGRAEQRLDQAKEQLGQHDAFDGLARRLDQGKKAKDVERKSEWAERRGKEAEAMLQEAVRDALGGRYPDALTKLDAAQRLDPTLEEDIVGRRRDYRAALQRQRAQESRAAAFDAALKAVDGALDGLDLDRAAELLEQARRRFPEPEQDSRLQLLEERLAGLRLDAGSFDLPTPETVPSLGLAAKQAIRERESSAARAYSWKQALLYPLRSPAALTTGALLSAAVSLVALHLPAILLILPLGASWWATRCAASTLDPRQKPDPSSRWNGPIPGDLGTALLPTLAALLPFVPIFALRSGLGAVPTFWWAATALLLWLGALAWTLSLGVGAAFGPRHARRLVRHGQALRPGAAAGGPFWVVVNLVFLCAATAILIRGAVVPEAPLVGIPAVAALEAYSLLLCAHLVGWMLRSRRLDWATIYA